MKFSTIALVGIVASSCHILPSAHGASTASSTTGTLAQQHDDGESESSTKTQGDRGYLRSLQSSASWPQCGTPGDCRAECSDRCEFSVKFNTDCCSSDCPMAAGCPGMTTGSGKCNNTLPGEVERRCESSDDCTVSTCTNAADKTGQLCTQPYHCVSLSRQGSGWFEWTTPQCEVDEDRPGMCVFTEQPSSMPSMKPSGAPSAGPSAIPSSAPSAIPSTTPTSAPSSNSGEPSASPSAIPSSAPSASPSTTPTSAPSSSPSDVPSSMPSCSPDFEGPNCDIPAQEYTYDLDNDDCDVRVIDGNTGNPIIEHEGNVVVKFWAFGDVPYDEEASTGNERACCQESGGLVPGGCIAGQDTCDASDCGIDPDQTNGACSFNGTDFRCAPGCVFEGREYDCWRNTIIPYMNNSTQDSEVSFGFFTGDFLKGNSGGDSGFCNPDSFASRYFLFNETNVDVVFTPGDNDWNECNAFGGEDNTDNDNVIRRMYRSFFASQTTFTRDFRSQAVSGYPARPPTIHRDFEYPELFYYVWNDVSFVGVSAPDGWEPPNGRNEDWIRESLARIFIDYPNQFASLEEVCTDIRSVVVLSHTSYFADARTQIDNFFGDGNGFGGFNGCGRDGTVLPRVPLLSVRGNRHEYSYCEEDDNTFEMINGGDLSPDPEESDPHLVTILRDPRTGDHFFRVDRNDFVSDGCTGFNSS